MNIELLLAQDLEPKHPSALRLLEYQSEELEGAAKARVEAHVASCPACAARLAEARAEQAAFLIQRPTAALLAGLEQRRPTSWWRRWVINAPTRPWVALGALATAAALLIALRPAPEIIALSARPSTLTPSTRIKAGCDLTFHVKSGAEIRVGEDGDALYPGDQIQLRVSTPQPTHLVIVSLDGSGAVTPFYDDEGWALEMEAGVAQLLEGSVVLDDALGAERVLGCFSESPVSTQAVLDAAAEALEAVDDDPRRVERLDLPCEQASFLIEKVER